MVHNRLIDVAIYTTYMAYPTRVGYPVNLLQLIILMILILQRSIHGVVVGRIPQQEEDPALWHIVHDDGDEEDLEEEELKDCLVSLTEQSNDSTAAETPKPLEKSLSNASHAEETPKALNTSFKSETTDEEAEFDENEVPNNPGMIDEEEDEDEDADSGKRLIMDRLAEDRLE